MAGVVITGSFGPVIVGDGSPTCARNDIVNGVVLDANQSVELDGNRVSGSVSVLRTAGTATGPVVAANQITLGLACEDNSPAPTNDGRANAVGGARTGQCAAL